VRARAGGDLSLQSVASTYLGTLAAVRGHFAEAAAHLRDAAEYDARRGAPRDVYVGALVLAAAELWGAERPERAVRTLDALRARLPLDSVPPAERPYVTTTHTPGLVQIYAAAGETRRARALLAEYERVAGPNPRRVAEQSDHGARGELALAEGRPADAVAAFRSESRAWGYCDVCGLVGLGRAYERLGEPDSALAAYERYVTTPSLRRVERDAFELPGALRRLAELHDARGDTAKAAHYYAKFVYLWRDADPELRPQVDAARRRLAALGDAPPDAQ
jgi:tetratricopeptide (TPR) repeat protein